MATQILNPHRPVIVIDECSGWIERALVRGAEILSAKRRRHDAKCRLRLLRRLSPRLLADAGLDDPQIQLRHFGVRLERDGDDLEVLRLQLLARR